MPWPRSSATWRTGTRGRAPCCCSCAPPSRRTRVTSTRCAVTRRTPTSVSPRSATAGAWRSRLSGLGGVLMMDGDVAGAIEAFEKSMAMLAELRAGDDVAEQLMRLAMARARSGDMAGARRDVALALEKAEERRSPMMISFARFGFGELDRLEGDLVGARRHFMDGSRRAGPVAARAAADRCDRARGPGPSRHRRGRPRRCAQTHLQTALELAIGVRDMPIAAIVGVGLAELALARDDPAAGRRCCSERARPLRGAEDRSNADAIAHRGELSPTALGAGGLRRRLRSRPGAVPRRGAGPVRPSSVTRPFVPRDPVAAGTSTRQLLRR